MFFPLLATYIYIKQKCNFTVSFNNISTHFYFIIHDSVLKAITGKIRVYFKMEFKLKGPL